MIAALQKRPLSRPLFIWIIGILLQAFFHFELIVGICLLCSFLSLLAPRISPDKAYSGKCYWGVVFTFLLLAVSVITTELAEKRLNKSSSPNELHLLASAAQKHLSLTIDDLDLDDAEKSLLATLTVGYKQTLDSSVRQRFSATGVSHILAVSGFHVAVVCGLLSFILGIIPSRGAGGWVRTLLLLLSTWSYVWITGLAPSSVRAGVMFSFFLIGQLLKRRGDSYNTLAAAALCMLVYNPFYLFDIGFQLSFSAVWFILYWQPRFSAIIEVCNPLIAKLWGVLSVTLAAQIGTLPLCLYYFGTFSTLFLLVNLPVALISTVLIPMGILWLILPAHFPGCDSLRLVVEWLTHGLMLMVDRFSRVPFASLQFSFGLNSLLTAYLVLFLISYYIYKPNPRILLLLLCVVLTGLLTALFALIFP